MNLHIQPGTAIGLAAGASRHSKKEKKRKPLILFAFLLTLLVPLTLSGCVGFTGASTPAQNASSTNSPSGALAANATSFNFGQVAVGSHSQQSLTFSNTGTAPVMVSQGTVTGTGFSVPGGISSVSIAAGQSQAFAIQFVPIAAGAVAGNILVTSDASSTPMSISLSGVGLAGPSVTTQPANQTVTAGQTATFSVAATGSAPISYQWQKNGAIISGASSSSYTTPVVTSSDNGAQFSVVVTDSTSSATSGAATLTVTAAAVAPAISTQPVNQTVTAGQTATFSVAATGTSTLTYQWKKSGASISGATSSTYTTAATTTSDSGSQFTVVVTNSVGSATSNSATLTVAAQTLILDVNTTTLSFGNVTISTSSTKNVILTNAGNSSVTISNVSISGPGFNAGGVSTGLILTSGQTATLNVTFTPSVTGSVSGSVTVTSNATNSPATVSLSGSGVQPVSHAATLTWTASTSSVSGYNLYRSSISGGPYTKINSSPIVTTSYVDSTVQAGLTYYYVVTSMDSTGTESTYSNQVLATIPTP